MTKWIENVLFQAWIKNNYMRNSKNLKNSSLKIRKKESSNSMTSYYKKTSLRS